MATRARIGIKQKSGRIIASYQHWDGYPGGLGYNLCEHWEDKKKVTEAIKLGDSSKWHYIAGNEIDFDDRSNPMYDVQNVYYGRDRGEKGTGYKIYKDEAEYIREGFNSGEQYVYLMKLDGEKDYMDRPRGTWYYVESRYTEDGKEVIDDAFKPLEEDAIKDHIDILNRHLEMKKETKKVELKKPNNKKVQNQQKSLERKITKLEEKQTSLEFELYETSDAEKLKEIQSELDNLKREIEKNFELLTSFGN